MRKITSLFLAMLLLGAARTASAVYYEDSADEFYESDSSVYYEDTGSEYGQPIDPGYEGNPGYEAVFPGYYEDSLQDSYPPTEAAEEVFSNSSDEGNAAMAGDAVAWYIDGSTLYITGQGDMYDFPNGAPWALYKNAISRVVISGGVTSVGAYAFHDFDGLYSVDFGSSIAQIGAGAFYSCDGLSSVTLPASFKKFGADSFRSCANLKEFHCSGGFPRFDENCLWDTECTIYYSASNPWAVSLVEQLETAFHNRIEFRGSDGSDPYVPTEAALPNQPLYVPETIAPTQVPVFQPAETLPVQTTMPVTAPATVPTIPSETESTKETFLLSAQPTRPTESLPARGHGTDGNSIFGVLIIALTLSMIATAALLFHVTNRRGPGKKHGKGRR